MAKQVFILEDDEGIREVITMILEGELYQVTSFSNVQDFSFGHRDVLADLYVLDVMLPDGDGFEVCKQLKSSLLTQNTPVLMMSAHAGLDQMRISCAADGFITKPFDINEFLNKVSSQLQKQ